MRKYEAVLLDLFNTLIVAEYPERDRENDVPGIAWEVWRAHEYGPEALRFYEHEDLSGGRELMRAIAGACGVACSDAQAEEMLRRRAGRVRRAMTELREGVEDTLRELRRLGVKIAIVSNADTVDVLHWKDSPLAPLADAAIFSCAEGVVKPDPAIYRLAMRRVGSAPERTLFVGDGGSDELRGAKAVGLTTVKADYFLRWQGDAREGIMKYADYIADDIRDVVSICVGEENYPSS